MFAMNNTFPYLYYVMMAGDFGIQSVEGTQDLER